MEVQETRSGPNDENAKGPTLEDAEKYRIKFWESPVEQEDVVIAMNCKEYKGFFTHENIRKWADSINDRDVAFRLGYTLGFSELAVNSFTGIFHIDYDRKADSMFHDAIYEFICNYLALNPNETDFRFYRRVREVLKLSSWPFNIFGCPRGAQKTLKARIKKETYEYTMDCTFRDKYEDHFMRWLLEEFDKRKDDCLALFEDIIKQKTKLERYKHILCLDDIDDYFTRVKKKRDYEEKLKAFEEHATKHYTYKIINENSPKKNEVTSTNQETLSPDNEQSSTSDEKQSSTKKKRFPEYPTETPKFVEYPLFKLIKIYSTVKGYLMDSKEDQEIRSWEEKLRQLFSHRLINCFLPVERNLTAHTKCNVQYDERLFTDQYLINLIRVVDSNRMWKGDMLHSLRDHNIELERKFANCRWLRTFRVLCIWRAKWPEEKFALTLDQYLLHKNYEGFAKFREIQKEGKYVTTRVYAIEGPSINSMF